MIRFRMLGALELRDSQGREFHAVLRRPKLLALLAYLAIARPSGFHRRDTLVALLWPELDHSHARNALRQALHALRHALGRDVLLSRGEEELGINDGRLSCDVRDFETALDAGQPEKALELYRGGLLNGLYVSGAPGFERWLDQEREHIRRRAVEAARLLMEREEVHGDRASAARWALRVTELSPEDETAVRRLIQLLDRLGDRTGAVRAYDEFERRLARDLDLSPSPETRALVEEIRARLEEASADARAEPARTQIAPDGSAADVGADEPGRSRVRRVASAPRARKRVAVVPALIVGGLLTGGWLLFQGAFGARTAETGHDPKRLVVLPFENLGPAEDLYFADGISEEIAARLAAIDRLRVIGGTSASLYRSSEKTIQEIGAQLGVDYVLEGTVRWQRSTDGLPRVRVTPQLVSTADGSHLWVQVYDEPLDEIFRVQSDIARKVVWALDVTLLEAQRSLVESVPTRNLAAYDHYLRGNDYLRRGQSERNRRAAIRMYERAVELDPSFALAYAQLSRMHSQMYGLYYDRSGDRLAAARRALDRAFELEPGLPEAHLALGAYYFNGYKEYDRALREFAIVAARRPSDKYVYLASGILRTRRGDLPGAFEDFERAEQLDPASPILAYNRGRAYDLVRDFARAEALYDRAIALSPDYPFPYFQKVGLYLRWEGSTGKARGVLDEARAVGIADDALVLFSWVLVAIFDRKFEEAIGRLSAGAPEVIEDRFSFIPRAQLYGQAYGLMGQRDRERAYYDSARAFVERALLERPDDPRLRSALGIAYAGLGRKRAAVEEGEKARELVPIDQHADGGYYRVLDLARIYAMVGKHDAAVDLLEDLLSIPGHLTGAWLRIDPTWDPLRGHPRFEQLLRRSAL